jgi:guanylate kinase
VKKKAKRRGRIFVISGPSGSGKSTLVRGVRADRELKKKLARSVSYTTRPRRSGERSGRDYFFISEKDFKDKLRAKKILEWTRYLGYYYGTPLDFVRKRLREGLSIALCLDFRGARILKRLFPSETVTIFVTPGSLKELPRRISGRSVNTGKEEIRRRLALAKKEIKNISRYDYRIVNKDLKKALRELKCILRNEMRAKKDGSNVWPM